ncbi:AvrD family protein [Streptomyces sp. NPDC003023]|uniref:AvrD family protein n=1 Tax=Streptomyces sp. NPDC003023 TaxID=3364675 RepID=UPI0036A3F60A
MPVTVSRPDTLALASADDFLGDRRTRFLGEGFKRVTHALTGITVIPAAAAEAGAAAGTTGRIEATASIRVPGLWSQKGGSRQRPHLSTIDAMVLAAQLTGLYAAHTHGLTRKDPFTVRSLSIRAGSAPDEDGIHRFGVGATHRSTLPAPEPGHARTTMDCHIGSMTVRVEAEHPDTAARDTGEGFYAAREFLPGPWNDNAYGVSHRTRHQLLSDINADPGALTADARLDVTADIEGTRRSPRPATMIDLFTAALQLGQILLYRLDGVDRAVSNTLWMRRTSITPAPAGEDAGDGRLRVRLARPAELPTADGVWRSARITATHAGMHLVCHVAHRLPRHDHVPALAL